MGTVDTNQARLNIFQILVIEDDQYSREAISEILEEWGYDVLQAENGREGIRRFDTTHPSLVMTDLKMPGIGGLEVLKYVQTEAPDIPVIVVSGTDDIEDVKRALRLGAVDFVSKPISDIDALEHTVHKAVAKYLLYFENQKYQQLLEEEVSARTAELCRQLAERIQMEQTLKENKARIHQAHEALVRSYDATLQGWSMAMELRDRETEGHSMRVTDMTVQLAKMLGAREEELRMFRYGAMLHDIGKLGIPDSILFKPGKLTDEEWEIMKRHPVYAYEMLAPIEYLKGALDIPHFHHERWDGSGYPLGLKGEEIPLAARIFAIVDVWDALSSDRPYRNRWEKEQVIEYIKSLSGIQFDPKVVEAFLYLQGEGI